MTKAGKNTNGPEQENATALLVDLNGVRPNDPRTSTGVAFFSTNSTGKLAFLHNMIAIYKLKHLREELLLECGNGKVQNFQSRVLNFLIKTSLEYLPL